MLIMSHLLQNNYTYKRTEFSHCVTNLLNTKPTYCTKTDSTHWSRTVHQRGHKHSETCFVNYFYWDLFHHHNTQHHITFWKLPVVWRYGLWQCKMSYCDWQNVHKTTVKNLYASIVVKPLSIFPICIIFLRHSCLLVLQIHSHEQCINVSGASCLKVLYDSINLSEFLVQTHNIPRMIISEEKTVKATWHFWNVK
jgi:hypothetical protein